MNCPKCGSVIEGNVSFCPACGTPLTQGNAAPNQQNDQTNDQYQQNGQPNNQYQQNAQYNYQYQYTSQYQQNGPFNNQYQPGGYRVPVANRNIALAIILSIITCGIYGIIWQIQIVDDLNTASQRQGDASGLTVFLLGLITCNIYNLYWFYKAGEKVNYVKQYKGEPADSNTGILYLLLSLFGLSIVNYCLIQSELNKVSSQPLQ